MANSTPIFSACTFLVIALLHLPISGSLAESPENHVAFFIFGDSLLDAGNNVYLNGSPNTNFWPYGKTFFRRPTGRVCDGRIVPDFIAEYAKLPLIKPYLEPGFKNYSDGANFASAGAGVLPATHPGTIHLKLQLSYFEEVGKRLRVQLGDADAKKLLSKAVYMFSIGGNDYAGAAQSTTNQSSALASIYRKRLLTMVLGNFTDVIKRVYEIGGRKFGFQNVGPIGCMPATKASTNATGGCVHEPTVMAKMHNDALSKLLEKLESQLLGFKYALYDYYTVLAQRTLHPSKFGFKVGSSACCGSGAYNGEFTCGGRNGTVKYKLCINPSEYVWFDAAHPTETANSQLAQLFWSGNTNITRPYNLKTLFEMLQS